MNNQTAAAELRASGLELRYGDVVALADLSLELPTGSLTAVLGPSGCGKTSLLRCLAGFESPERGVIELGGVRLLDTEAGLFVPPEKREIGLVFQQGALFPHLTVARNVAYGLRRGQDPSVVTDCLERVGLHDLGDRFPDELSGGQAQRVALARALVPDPKLILLDEPFANLDASSRQEVREEVLEVLRKAGTTCLLVTHDQEEALSSADHLMVMAHGRKLQEGTPQEVYRCPSSALVADFLGGGALLDLEATKDGLRCVLGELALRPIDRQAPGELDLKAFVRPEEIECVESGQTRGTISKSTYYGHDRIFEITLDDGLVLPVRQLSVGSLPKVGERVGLRLRPGAGWLVEGGAASRSGS